MLKNILFSFLILVFLSSSINLYAETSQESEVASIVQAQAPAAAVPAKEESTTSVPGNVTLNFKDADINTILRVLSLKSGVNIVADKDVKGTVSIRLVDVPWEVALDTILKVYDFGYDKKGNIITITTLEKYKKKKEEETKLAEIQPVITDVFTLKYIDAGDAMTAVKPHLSAKGKIAVLEMSGQAGWEFTKGSKGESFAKVAKEEVPRGKKRSKILIVSDVPPVMERIRDMIAKIDTEPQQVLIEARIMEVSRNKLRDLGVEFGTGSDGKSAIILERFKDKRTDPPTWETYAQGTGQNYTLQVTPANFVPQAAALSGVSPFNAGATFLFQKLLDTQFEVLIHMLEEDVSTNTLSAPRVIALNNQEASILVGTKYPIIKPEVSVETNQIIGASLDYYQDIGIQLNVIPQISEGGFINMVIHPAVSSQTGTVTQRTATGQILSQYPILSTREAETRILIRDGETIMLGGLLKDVKSDSIIGVPILSKLPFLGILFRRTVTNVDKIDLLIFLTARIIKPGQFTPEELEALKQRQETFLNLNKKQPKNKKSKSTARPTDVVSEERPTGPNRGFIFNQ